MNVFSREEEKMCYKDNRDCNQDCPAYSEEELLYGPDRKGHCIRLAGPNMIAQSINSLTAKLNELSGAKDLLGGIKDLLDEITNRLEQF